MARAPRGGHTGSVASAVAMTIPTLYADLAFASFLAPLPGSTGWGRLIPAVRHFRPGTARVVGRAVGRAPRGGGRLGVGVGGRGGERADEDGPRRAVRLEAMVRHLP